MTDRLEQRISRLLALEEGCWRTSRKRFYDFCRYCDRDRIGINMHGHFRGCIVKGTLREVAHYERLLADAKRDERRRVLVRQFMALLREAGGGADAREAGR